MKNGLTSHKKYSLRIFLYAIAGFSFIILPISCDLFLKHITTFVNHLESSSGHTLSFYLHLVKYRFKNMLPKESLTRSFNGYPDYKLRRVKCKAIEYSQSLRRRKYDPVIIERTISLLLGPSSALYISVLKHCTLTNKTLGTIWRDLSKPPQRRQALILVPSDLIVSRDSCSPVVDGPELASTLVVQLPLANVHIFLIYCFYHLKY